MESQASLLLERISLGNHDLNKSTKYLDHFQTSNEYYERIDNKLNDFLRVSYYLTNFLISTPFKYVPPENGLKKDKEEELRDYDAPAEDKRNGNWEFHQEGYKIEDLDLPVSVESEFDFHFVYFQAFLSYLKPTNYFIHAHELIPVGRDENYKESITRVLANLVQFLVFVRSFKEEYIQDLRSVSYCLFDGFTDYFQINKNEENNSGSSVSSFFEEYPEDAALLSWLLVAYDQPPSYSTYNDILDTVQFKLNAFENFPEFHEYNTHLKSYENVLIKAMETSTTIAEFQLYLQKTFRIESLKSKLFGVAKALTNKLLKEIGKFEEETLNNSFLSINYEKQIDLLKSQYEKTINDLRPVIEKEIEESNQKILNDLKTSLEKSENENQLLKEQVRLKEDEIETTKRSVENSINNNNSSTNLTYQDLETSYPKLFQSIKVSMSKLYTSKYFGQIDELQTKVLELEKRLAQQQSSGSINGNDFYRDTEDQKSEGYYDDGNSSHGGFGSALVPHQPSPHPINSPVAYHPVQMGPSPQQNQLQHIPMQPAPAPIIQSIPMARPPIPPGAMQQQQNFQQQQQMQQQKIHQMQQQPQNGYGNGLGLEPGSGSYGGQRMPQDYYYNPQEMGFSQQQQYPAKYR